MLPYISCFESDFVSNIFSRSALLKAWSLDRRLHVRGYVVDGGEDGGGGKQFRNSVCSLFLEVLFV